MAFYLFSKVGKVDLKNFVTCHTNKAYHNKTAKQKKLYSEEVAWTIEELPLVLRDTHERTPILLRPHTVT